MIVVGVAGGSGSGKTTLVKALAERLSPERVVVIPQDAYYKDMKQASEEEKRVHNFDHPDSIDWDLLCDHLSELKSGSSIEQPVYSYLTCRRSETETVHTGPADIVIIEGILIFTCTKLREHIDLKLFVHTDDDDRLMRVMARDIQERGKDVNWVIERYKRTVKPMYLQFIEPSSRFADIIIPWTNYNTIAIDAIANTLEHSLASK